jgi:hypothetical protein
MAVSADIVVRINLRNKRAFENLKTTARYHHSQACYIGPMLRGVQSSSSEAALSSPESRATSTG